MFDAAAEREESLEAAGDVGFDLLGRHSVVERRHHDHWNFHGGEHVHRHARQRRRADYRNHQADDDDEVWITDGKSRHRYSFTAAMVLTFGRTSSPACRPLRPAITTRS